MAYRKQLIEFALRLEVINQGSAREKSIPHGQASTLHLWVVRRPPVACRDPFCGDFVLALTEVRDEGDTAGCYLPDPSTGSEEVFSTWHA